MKGVVKSAVVFGVVLMFGSVSLADAADQRRTRDRKRDGSCLNWVVEENAQSLASIQKRDRKRDKTCMYSPSDEGGFSVATDQKRIRDRKRDGSCRV